MNHITIKCVIFVVGIFERHQLITNDLHSTLTYNFKLEKAMENKKINKERIILAAKELIEAKKNIIAYSNNEISKKELNDRGVRLTKPL